jgi:uncharacterized Zn-binding protein involved in type VI secretion
MLDPLSIQRLVRDTSPSDAFRAKVLRRVEHKIRPEPLMDAVSSVQPTPAFRETAKNRMFKSIRSGSAALLPGLAGGIDMSPARRAELKEQVLARLDVRRAPWASGFIKWTAAFAAFVLLVRSLPLVLMAPVLQAETLVQIVASGDVEVTIAGIQITLNGTNELRGPAIISTGPNSQATVIFNDDGVLRVAPNSKVHVLDIGDRPHFASLRPTVTLEKGQVWVLGMLPASFTPISVGTSQGTASVNAGSMSVNDDGKRVMVAVYDRGASFQSATKEELLVSGERLSAGGKSVTVSKMPASQFLQTQVSVNLDLDGVHRTEIREVQRSRREKMAGILPGSTFYTAKRISEHIDVMFTLDQDSKEEKIAQQADTRLNEAMTLMDYGQQEEAEKPLTEFKNTLVALADSSGSTTARFLVQQQIDEASSSLVLGADSDDQITSLQQTVLDLSTAIPDADQSHIKSYVLVDKLIELNQSLQMSASLSDVVQSLNEISPELEDILNDESTHPLLKKEATSLLASVSEKLNGLAEGPDDPVVVAAQAGIAQYLPQDTTQVLVTEAQLDKEIDDAFNEIFSMDMPRSRYNVLMNIMTDWRVNQDPNRGTKLRRLYRKLPPNFLAGYVRTEIKNMGDELNNGTSLGL